jgi:methionyl-tRNA formyltransferase
MKRFAFVIYRKWAFEIYKAFGESVLITTPKREFDCKDCFVVDGRDQEKIFSILTKHKIEVVFFYGWSDMVKEPILSNFLCLCLHPSLLPRYRGGSPLQNQIIDNRRKSGVTVFRMGKGIDDGDIYEQIPISLAGTLDNIFERITKTGITITKHFLKDLENGRLKFKPQGKVYPVLKRRREEESEILFNNLSKMSYMDLYNFVRCLADPYPNAFIKLPDAVLFISKVKRLKKIPKDAVFLGEQINNKSPIVIKLKSGFALIEKYKLKYL